MQKFIHDKMNKQELKAIIKKIFELTSADSVAFAETLYEPLSKLLMAVEAKEDISEAIPAIQHAEAYHFEEHGCGIENTVAQILARYYVNTKQKKKLEELSKSPGDKTRYGTIESLGKILLENPRTQEMELLIKGLADEEQNNRINALVYLEIIAKKSKENVELILATVAKSNIDKNIQEVKTLIKLCEEKL